MKKKLIIITTVVIMLFSVVSSLPVSAYVAPGNIFSLHSTSNSWATYFVSPPSNGIYIFHTLYSCKVSPSAPGLSLIDMLDDSSIQPLNSSSPIIWQGTTREEDNLYLKDVSDVVGFSQTYSYSSSLNWFIYEVTTCIPVVEGDSFKIYFKANTDFSTCRARVGSFIPYGTGCSKVYESFSTTSTDSSCSYVTKSDNQHLALFLNPSTGNYIRQFSSSSVSSSSSNNLTFGISDMYSDFYTTTYGLSKNSEITVTPNDNVVDWSFSVYEIFTDGTSTPGIGDSGGGSGGSGSGGTVGDITVNVDMSETNGKLDTLIAAVKALPSEIWDCFKVGLGITSDSGSSGGSSSGGTSGGASSILPPSDGDLKVELDPDEVGNTLDTVESDFSSMLERTRGAFNFFWTFTNKFFTSLNLYGIVGVSLIFSLVVWLMNCHYSTSSACRSLCCRRHYRTF